MYPTEYLTYGLGSNAEVVTAPDAVKTFKITDHLGSTRAEIKERGRTQHWDYEPYGKAVAGAPPRKGFIDREKDKESGLGDFGVRKYDDEIGRFLSPDPLWENYRAWSPYQYSANNPILAIDAGGDKIKIVSDDPGFRRSAFDNLQKLTNTRLVLLTNGEVTTLHAWESQQKAYDTYGSEHETRPADIEIIGINSTDKNLPAGTKLISDILADSHIAAIKQTDRSDAVTSRGVYGKRRADGTPNKGESVNIWHNPYEDVEPSLNADGTRSVALYITLGHELTHALRTMSGIVPNGLSGMLDPDGSGYPLSIEELEVRILENSLRGEHGITLRALSSEPY